jgi:hypothetical protein
VPVVRRLLLASLLSIAGLACGGSEEDVRDVPTIEVGFVDDGVFEPVDPGSQCLVVNAPQGGFWIMPTLRISGTEREATIECSLEDITDGQMLGSAEALRMLDDAGGGWWEKEFFLNLSAVRTVDDYQALHGHDGRLACTVTDEFASAEFAADVKLESFIP